MIKENSETTPMASLSSDRVKSPLQKSSESVKQKFTLSSTDQAIKSFSDVLFDYPHGFLPLKPRYPINFQKGGTFFFVLFLMSYYNNFSLGSYVYLALHGAYGWIWLLKDVAFPDSSFNKKVGLFTGLLFTCLVLAYWGIAWIQISGLGIDNPSNERIMCCIMLLAIGAVIMVASDAQKTFTMKYKKELINDGMFKYTRNPNYLGEMMLYSSFALLTGNMYSWMILITAWVVVFSVRMAAKDISLKQKEGSQEYFAQSSILLPKLFFRNTVLHYLSWAAVAGAIYYIYHNGGIQKTFLRPEKVIQIQ